MKKIFIILVVLLFIFSCTEQPVINDVTEIINVDEKFLTYCDIELFSMECWSINSGEWITLDIPETNGTKSLIQLELIHNGGQTSELISMSFRQDEFHNVYHALSSFNSTNGDIIMTTNDQGQIQYRNDWDTEEARKILIILKLKMY
jgi:hypothetical protein